MRFGRHGAFYLWQVWSSKALFTTLQTAHKSPSAPSDAKFLPLRGADCNALRRTISFMGGGAPKKAAGKNEKYINTQLAAAVLELKEP